MPSKSDIQFGKIVVTNRMATKEEVESALKEQARFERERHTAVLEAILLYRDCLTVEQVEAIQKRMSRRVIFCGQCHGKFNVFQFRGSEKFLCHKCGNRITVPDGPEYREEMRKLVDSVRNFFESAPEDEIEVEEVVSAGNNRRARGTITVRREDVEDAKKRRDAARDQDDILEPVEEPLEAEEVDEMEDLEEIEAAVEELEVEGVAEEEIIEEPEPEEEPQEEEPAPPPQRVKLKKKIKPRNGGEDEGRPRIKSSKLKKKKGSSGERPKLKRRR